MAAFCPNRHRHKRPHPGGGNVECRGRLVAALNVGILLPVKSMRNPDSAERSLRAYTMKYGVRVMPQGIVAAWRSAATCDIRCDTCSYSLNALRRGLRVKAKYARTTKG